MSWGRLGGEISGVVGLGLSGKGRGGNRPRVRLSLGEKETLSDN